MNDIIKTLAILIVFIAVGLSCSSISGNETKDDSETKEQKMAVIDYENLEKAYFAGGCFWCMQPPFDRLEGVVETWVGYSGGTEKDPTYNQVASGQTSHAEAIEVVYDPEKISYEKILETFWINVDPTQANGQFADKGRQYRAAIFYVGEPQKKKAEASIKELEESGKFNNPIVTIVEEFKTFYRGEDYHQKYYEKNPIHYNLYKKGSGREGYIKKTWKDGFPDD